MVKKSIVCLSTDPEGFSKYPDELTPDMFTSAIPVQHTYSYYEDESIGLFIGVWDTNTMAETPGPYACEEFMWLIEGECQIKNNKTGAIETAKAGEAFIIPKGYDCQWQQNGYLRKFYVISEHPEETMPAMPIYEGIIIPKADVKLTRERDLQLFVGIKGEKDICYRDVTDKFISGIWASDLFKTEQNRFPHNAFFYVESGSITLIDDADIEYPFDEGDAFFIPEGVQCSVNVIERVKMFFTIIKSV